MSIPIRAGRVFESRDSSTAPHVAVITDALERREWPDGDPIGARIRVTCQGRPLEAEVIAILLPQIERHDLLAVAHVQRRSAERRRGP
jgi:hypothetical protein